MAKKGPVLIFLLAIAAIYICFYIYMPSVRLASIFYSGSKFTDVENILNSQNLTWELVEDSKTPEFVQPPHHDKVIYVENHIDLNEKVSIQLRFYNDKLMSVAIYPQDYNAYLLKVKQKISIIEVSKKLICLNPRLSIWPGIDFMGRRNIYYGDKRIIRSFNKSSSR